MKSIRKAAETVSSTISQQIGKKQKIVLHDLNEEYIDITQAKLSRLTEDNMVSELIKKGFTVVENDINMLKKSGREFFRDKLQTADYIIGYRLLKCGVEYEDGSVPKAVKRNAVTKLNVRVVNAKTGNVIWAGETNEIESDEVDRRAIRYLKMTDISFDGYDEMSEFDQEMVFSTDADDVTFEDNIAGDETRIGLSDWVLAGVGYSQWSSLNAVFEAGFGYKVSPEITAGLNFGYFPYSLSLDNNDEEFNGQVFLVYFSGESYLFSFWKVSSYITVGAGMYVYIGKVDAQDDSYSGSGATLGVNSGMNFRIPLKDKFYFNLSAKYHYTNYEFGENFQFITGGINYQF